MNGKEEFNWKIYNVINKQRKTAYTQEKFSMDPTYY